MVTYTIMAALQAGLTTLLEYLSAHVLTCLVPAFFIAGAISALLHKETVLKYFGADAPKWLCYSVAATSGTILAVCSCTILPMFAGIEKRGAGIGPATAFLFSGPAINLMAIILTARVLGLDLGIARAVAAVTMAVVIGLIMAAIFQKSEKKCESAPAPASRVDSDSESKSRPGYITGLFMAILVAILLVATSSLFELLPKAIIVGALTLTGCFSHEDLLPARRAGGIPLRDLVADQEDLSPAGGRHIYHRHDRLLLACGVDSHRLRHEQLLGLLRGLGYRCSALHAHLAGDPHCRNALRLQYRRHGRRPSAIAPAGRAFFEPAQHDSDHQSHWPEERRRIH